MKINLGINEPVNTGKSRSSGSDIRTNNTGQKDTSKFSGQVQDIPSKASINAIIISRIAQDFFNKALLITTRLKSLASDAAATGKMNNAEVTDALNEVKNSLAGIQKEYSPASQVIDGNSFVDQYTGTEISTRIKTGLDALNELAENVNAGRLPDSKNIGSTEKIIADNESAVKKIYERQIGFSHLTRTENEREDYAKISANTMDMIINNHQQALVSQGNISHDAARGLL